MVRALEVSPSCLILANVRRISQRRSRLHEGLGSSLRRISQYVQKLSAATSRSPSFDCLHWMCYLSHAYLGTIRTDICNHLSPLQTSNLTRAGNLPTQGVLAPSIAAVYLKTFCCMLIVNPQNTHGPHHDNGVHRTLTDKRKMATPCSNSAPLQGEFGADGGQDEVYFNRLRHSTQLLVPVCLLNSQYAEFKKYCFDHLVPFRRIRYRGRLSDGHIRSL
jgi:hypothetical protein